MEYHDLSHSDLGTGKKRLDIYLSGIFLCIILTLVPFYVVMKQSLSPGLYYPVIYAAAILQLLVQVFCFLRLNTQTEQGKANVMTFLFTLLILLVIVGGSLWIMWNLNNNMM